MSATRPPLSSRQAFLPDEIARREFNTAFRGYEPAEVRAFLAHLSEQAAEVADARAELQLALAESEARANNPELDEETVTRLLGEQTAQILRSAREAAAKIRQDAEDEVSISLREAHEASTRMREEASMILDEKSQEANTIVERMRGEVEVEVMQTRDRLAEEEARRREDLEQEIARRDADHRAQIEAELEDARQEGRNIIATARQEAAALVERTRAEQEEKLESILRKRSIALAQVEELRAGRQRLLDAYKMVRETLDDISGELERVDEEARYAASQAGQRAAAEAGLEVADLDEPIDLDEHVLHDDVPPSVINLVESDRAAGDNAYALMSRAQVSSADFRTGNSGQGGAGQPRPSEGGAGWRDHQDGGSDRDDTPGGGAGFFDNASTLDAVNEEDLWSPVEERLDDGIDLPGTSGYSGNPQGVASGMPATDSVVDVNAEVEAAASRSSLRTGAMIGEADRGVQAQADRLLLMRREATTTKNRPQAMRRLRNALQEEQDVITAQAQSGRVSSVEDLLGSVEDQASHYQHAIMKLFREIVRDGASSVQGSTGIALGEIERAGNDSARSLAIALVEDLREQLIPVLETDVFGGVKLPSVDLAKHISAPYDTIAGPYLDFLVDKRVAAAFDRGVDLVRS